MTYEEWDAYTTELQNKHGYKATSQGALAKVSIYEFVNDWLRPEISFKIFSYLGDPHKAGVWKSQHKRRRYTTTTKLIDGTFISKKRKWRWAEAAGRNLPYSRLTLYRQIANNKPYYNDGIARRVGNWALPYNQEFHRLQHNNKLLQDLWVATFWREQQYITTKEELQELCKINKVKGRTNLFKPKNPHPLNTNHRQPIITALIKLE